MSGDSYKMGTNIFQLWNLPDLRGVLGGGWKSVRDKQPSTFPELPE